MTKLPKKKEYVGLRNVFSFIFNKSISLRMQHIVLKTKQSWTIKLMRMISMVYFIVGYHYHGFVFHLYHCLFDAMAFKLSHNQQKNAIQIEIIVSSNRISLLPFIWNGAAYDQWDFLKNNHAVVYIVMSVYACHWIAILRIKSNIKKAVCIEFGIWKQTLKMKYKGRT